MGIAGEGDDSASRWGRQGWLFGLAFNCYDHQVPCLGDLSEYDRTSQRLPATMPNIESEREQHRLLVGNWQVTFCYAGDRWRHAFLLRQADEWLPVVSSLEGSANDRMPPSPAFQELRVEQPGGDAVEFQLFGQAGDATYSAAVAFDPQTGCLTFDVCARGRKPGVSFCTTCRYGVEPHFRVKLIDEKPRVLHGNQPAGAWLEFGPLAVEGGPVAACRIESPEAAPQVIAEPSRASSCGAMPGARSVRWKYRIRLSGLP